MPHHNPRPQYETGPGIEPGTFRLANECSTTDQTLLLGMVHISSSLYRYKVSGQGVSLGNTTFSAQTLKPGANTKQTQTEKLLIGCVHI